MKNKRCLSGRLDVKAFTLIELLVVVLIIGILAAVALPQYQKAVEKAKATQAITLLKSVYQAAETYYLTNGTEFTSFDELSLDIPWTGNTKVIGVAQDSKSNSDWSLEIESSSNDTLVIIYITRLTGRYKGTGFHITLRNPMGGHLGKGSIRCYERTGSSTRIFDTSLADGAYCVQIMKGTLSETGVAGRYYNLP